MKKRLLTMLLALMVATTSLVGCSFSIGNDKDSSIIDELKDKEDEDEDEKKEKKDKKNDKSDKKDKDENEDEKEDVDWSKAYDDYFEQFNFEDGLELSATTTESGVDMEIAVGIAENGTYMAMDISYEDNEPTTLKMYEIDDVLYVYYDMLGTNEWVYAEVEEDEAEELMSNDILKDIDTSAFDNAVYEKEVEEDGVIYDILLLEEDTTTSRFYIDRETQKLEKVAIEQDGETVDYKLKDIDEIKLPKEAKGARETTTDEIGMLLVGVILGAMGEDMEDFDMDIDVDTELEVTPETNENKPIKDNNVSTSVDADLNNPIFDENIVVNGKTYTLGESKPEDIKNGFNITFLDEDELNLVINPNYYESLFFYLGEDDKYTVWVYFANFTEGAQKLGDCTLYRINVEADGYTAGEAFEDDFSFVVGNAVTEDTKANDLLAAFGEPSYTYHSDDYHLDDYEYDLPLGADYFDCLYELEVGYNDGGMYSICYGIN